MRDQTANASLKLTSLKVPSVAEFTMWEAVILSPPDALAGLIVRFFRYIAAPGVKRVVDRQPRLELLEVVVNELRQAE